MARPLSKKFNFDQWLGLLIATKRADDGLTQGELALSAGVSRATVVAIELGKCTPASGTLLRIVIVLQLNIAEILEMYRKIYVDDLATPSKSLIEVKEYWRHVGRRFVIDRARSWWKCSVCGLKESLEFSDGREHECSKSTASPSSDPQPKSGDLTMPSPLSHKGGRR